MSIRWKMDQLPYMEPYKIKMVESITSSTKEQREKWLKDIKYNLFNLESRQVMVDLISDSGTGCMSDRQWSKMMLGDEAYAGASSYYTLKETVEKIFGFEHFLPSHQGRAAENVLFSVLVKENDIIPGNSQFDTTKAHIEFRSARAIDCTIDKAFNTDLYHPFKGNMCPRKLLTVINENPISKIPIIIFTLTNNNVGGQPVSMENIKEIAGIAKNYNIPLIFDAAQVFENAYFIKQRERGYEEKRIEYIVKEMFQYADMMTMSAKKGGLVNMGGLLAMRNKETYKKCSTYTILFEGFITYGGMSGRDMEALAEGLKEGMQEEYLESRINQITYLGTLLQQYGIPLQLPLGGHAVYVNAIEMLPNVPKEQFRAQTLAIELYKEAGVRTCAFGVILADRDPVTGANRYPKTEYIRLAIPRRVYTNNHMKYVAKALHLVYLRRDDIRSGYQITWEAPIARHFTVEFEEKRMHSTIAP